MVADKKKNHGSENIFSNYMIISCT